MTGDVEKDTNIVLELGQELLDVKPDPDVVRSYIELGTAVYTHEPEATFEGNVVLVQASDPSSHRTALPNEDYNVSKVISFDFSLKLCSNF